MSEISELILLLNKQHEEQMAVLRGKHQEQMTMLQEQLKILQSSLNNPRENSAIQSNSVYKMQFDPKRFVVRERFKFWSDMKRKPSQLNSSVQSTTKQSPEWLKKRKPYTVNLLRQCRKIHCFVCCEATWQTLGKPTRLSFSVIVTKVPT